MQHLPEILKIIEGAVQANSTMVISYAHLLADKLEKEGEKRSATRIQKLLEGPKFGSEPRQIKPQFLNKRGSDDLLPVDQDSRLSLADVTYPEFISSQVQLPEDIDSTVNEFLQFIDKSVLLSEAGVGISPSMLIYGPPGCGKTKLAHHIAYKLDLPLVTARCDTLISSFLGSTAKNLRGLFDHASSRPCVLFLDEFDAFAKARDDQHEVGELKRVVVSLLQNIDLLPDDTILLAATNHESLLDDAVWRRFAYRINIPLPKSETRKALLSQFLGPYYNGTLEPLVDITDGMNGAEIEQYCLSAIRRAIIDSDGQVDVDQLMVKFLLHRFQDIFKDAELGVDEKIVALRKADSRANTIKRLSSIFGVSAGKISQLTA